MTAFAALGLLLQTFLWQLVEAHGGSALRFFAPKWIAVYIFGAVSWGWMLRIGRAEIPGIGKWEGLALLFFFLSFLFVGWGYASSLGPAVERIAFLGCLILFWRGFSDRRLSWEDLVWPALLCALGLSAIGLVQVFSVGLLVHGEMPYFQIGSTVGHANNTAQWLAMLLAIGVGCFPSRHKVLAGGIVFLSAAYLLLLRCRSVWLALAVGLIVLMWPRHKRFLASLVGLGIAGVIFAGNFLQIGKASAIRFRDDLWRVVLEMIAAKPMGWGPDRFEFEHLPWATAKVHIGYEMPIRSAHNEIFRYLVEDGVPASLALFALLGALIWRASSNHEVDRRERRVVTVLACIFLVEGLIQFPFQNAPAVFLFSIWLAWILAKGTKPIQIPRPTFRWVIASLLFANIALGIPLAVSHWWAETDDVDKAEISCWLNRSNWRACRTEGFLRLKSGDIKGSEAVFLKSLAEAEHNYFAQRGMMEIALRKNNRMSACFWMVKQNKILGPVSPFRNSEEALCKSYGLPSH